MMFSVFCPTHGCRVLMTRRHVIGFDNGPRGPVIAWRCECGHEGLLDRDGSQPATPVRQDDASAVVVGRE